MMSSESWISLSGECRGAFGVMDAPRNIIRAIELAAQHSIHPPTGLPPGPTLILEQARRWKPEMNQMTALKRFAIFFLPRPVRIRLTVDQIEVREGPFRSGVLTPDDVRITGGCEYAWRWEGYTLAFAFVWAFLYHEKNEHLENPTAIFDRLKFLWGDRDGWPQFCLALYERIVGLYCDIAEERPHYVSNILKRKGMEADALKARPSCFQRCVSGLETAVCDELEQLLRAL